MTDPTKLKPGDRSSSGSPKKTEEEARRQLRVVPWYSAEWRAVVARQRQQAPWAFSQASDKLIARARGLPVVQLAAVGRA